MRIQLIRHDDTIHVNTRLPRSLNKRQGFLPPLGLAYIASSLENAGHEVEIIDAQVLGLSIEDITAQLKKFDPHLVGLTAMTPTIQTTLHIAEAVKKEGVKIVLGGPHLNLFPDETLSFDYVDYGILGEGEETMVDLCSALESNKSVADIVGLASKDNGNTIIQPPRIVDNPSKLPWPAYHLLPMDLYSSIIGLHPVSTIMGSRGCPFNCSFCYKGPSDEKFRKRDPVDIVDEMEFLVKKFNLKEIMFYDDCMPKEHVRAICEEILRRGLKIHWESPQRVNLVDPQLLKLMKKAGCRMLRFGVEQGDPEMMQVIEKKISLDMVKQAFRWAHEAGIDTFAYFIIGYLGETPETMKKTIALAKDINPRFVMFTKAVPLPATKLHEESVEKGFIDKDYWKDFSIGKTKTQIKEFIPDANDWVARAYKEFYMRPSKIFSQILNIRSFKDLKKNLEGFWGICFFRQN